MHELDDFISSMTVKMASKTTQIEGLKVFIQGLFDKIKDAVPTITPEQHAALDEIQKTADTHAAALTAVMVDTGATAPKV